MKHYFHIIIFLFTHDLGNLKKIWEIEFLHKDFSWKEAISQAWKRPHNFIFYWRLLNFAYHNGTKKQVRAAEKLSHRLNKNFNIEIPVCLEVGLGFTLHHLTGIVITSRVEKIGINFSIYQNTTIGFADYSKEGSITIGDNVSIMGHSFIFGQNLSIGNNVIVGAMSFVNKDIPDNTIIYTKKTNEIKTIPFTQASQAKL
ncbi:serine acetyltransferase [Gammaproteobacteria bacterium ESL0073]|nr:serine acetyltransferase [Gammaproteobacteria bacterium ESL0073]